MLTCKRQEVKLKSAYLAGKTLDFNTLTFT